MAVTLNAPNLTVSQRAKGLRPEVLHPRDLERRIVIGHGFKDQGAPAISDRALPRAACQAFVRRGYVLVMSAHNRPVEAHSMQCRN